MPDNSKKEAVVFGGGCFWCTEAVFKMIQGVSSVLPGYAGGNVPNPTYEDVCMSDTGHAEVVKIEYDPTLVKFETLLTIFFGSHDPTTLNRQGNDEGTQYRSVIFYTTQDQKQKAEDFVKNINNSSKVGAPVVTEILPLDTFYPAEDYHHDYFAKNPNNSYCMLVVNPKLEKVQKKFAEFLNNQKK